MSDIYRNDPAAAPLAAADAAPALSFTAVVAGAIAALALTLVLLAFGSAVGFSSVSPWSNSGVSAGTFHVASGLYLIVVAMIASTVGGYLAGRLRTRWKGLYSDETQFRDTAHGFLAWGLATVIGAAALGGAATFFVGGTAAGAAAGSAAAVSQSAGPSDYFVDMLFRPGSPRAAENSTRADASREVGTIFARSFTADGELAAADRAYLAQIVSARTGLNQAEAEKRVADVVTQAKAGADEARKAAAALSIWLTISMLVGAFSASLAAIEGGQLRDRRWKGIFGTRAYTEARIDN